MDRTDQAHKLLAAALSSKQPSREEINKQIHAANYSYRQIVKEITPALNNEVKPNKELVDFFLSIQKERIKINDQLKKSDVGFSSLEEAMYKRKEGYTQLTYCLQEAGACIELNVGRYMSSQDIVTLARNKLKMDEILAKIKQYPSANSEDPYELISSLFECRHSMGEIFVKNNQHIDEATARTAIPNFQKVDLFFSMREKHGDDIASKMICATSMFEQEKLARELGIIDDYNRFNQKFAEEMAIMTSKSATYITNILHSGPSGATAIQSKLTPALLARILDKMRETLQMIADRTSNSIKDMAVDSDEKKEARSVLEDELAKKKNGEQSPVADSLEDIFQTVQKSTAQNPEAIVESVLGSRAASIASQAALQGISPKEYVELLNSNKLIRDTFFGNQS